jgi:hypothetical protein
MGRRAISYHVPAYRVRSTEAMVESGCFDSIATQPVTINDQQLRMRSEIVFTADSR